MVHKVLSVSPKQVAPGIERPLFGQYARRLFPITNQQLADCLSEQTKTGERLGVIMKRNGLLNDEQIQEILRAQAKWIAESNRSEYRERNGRYPAFFSLCLPAYNEEDVIGDTVDSACTILSELFEEFEVLVVNDGSSDGTADIVGQQAERDSRVRLLNHEKNKGYGAAVTKGLRAARGSLIAFSDSDGQFSFLEFPQLLRELEGNDIVIGYRYRRADSFIRKCNAWAWGKLVHAILGVNARDLDCAFKIFRREVLEQVEMTSTGACINAEIMSQCVHGGARYREVPVSHFSRTSGTPTGANLKVIARAFKEFPQLWKYRSWKYGEDLKGHIHRPLPANTAKQPSSAQG